MENRVESKVPLPTGKRPVRTRGEPLYSIVLLAGGDPNKLEECLQLIATISPEYEVEVVVCTEGQQPIPTALPDSVSVHTVALAHQTTEADRRAQAFAVASGEVVLMADDDASALGERLEVLRAGKNSATRDE